MEGFLAARALGEESLQMWDLNKRLEAYLARVKFLEEENELLRAEIQRARDSPVESSWRRKCEEELRALRAALGDAFREKHAAELARDNLSEETQHVRSRCQEERAAQEEAKRQLALGKKELEEERRARIWLGERAAQLGKEAEALLEAHEEEKAGLQEELATFSRSLERFRAGPVPFQPAEVEDYSQRLSEIWRGAVETYRSEASRLESCFCRAKEDLCKAAEGNRQSQLQLQQLEKELAGLKARKAVLEESLAGRWQDRRGDAEKFQLALESLEQEKEALRVQIAHVLEERQHLMHLKMSLSLEVATYRTLLEAESSRLQMSPAEYKLANGFRDAKLEVSNSKLQAMTPESRRLVSWDYRLSPTTFQKGESKTPLSRNQNDSPQRRAASGLTMSDGPVAREFQKINSVLQSSLLKISHAVRDPTVRGNSTPIMQDSSHPAEVVTAAEVKTVANSFSQEPFERLDSMPEPEPLGRSDSDTEGRSPGAEGGNPAESQVGIAEVDQEDERQEKAGEEIENDPSEEPPGKLAPENSFCPSQLVNEALEDTLKDVTGRSESSCLEAARAPVDGLSYDMAPLEEASKLDASRGAEGLEEGQQLNVAKDDSTDEPDDGPEAHLEEAASEANLQEFQAVKSSSQQDGDESQSNPSTTQSEARIPDVLATEGRPEIETWEEISSWEQNESKDEEIPSLQSTEMHEEPATVCNSTEPGSPSDKGKQVLSGAEEKSWEAGIFGPSNLTVTEGNLEEPDVGEEDLERVSPEAWHLSEDRERRELWDLSGESEECSVQAEGHGSEFLQAEIQVTEAFPIENQPALVLESHQEQHCGGAEQDEFVEEEMTLHEASATVGEEERKERSLREAILRDETMSMEEENILADEPMDRRREDSEVHNGKLAMETMGGEDLSTEENTLRYENLKQEEDTLEEEVGDLKENGFEPDVVLVAEDLENDRKLESLGKEGRVEEEDYQSQQPKAQEGQGTEDGVGQPEMEETADIALQEPVGADTLMTITGETESEEEPIKGSLGTEVEEIMKDDDAGQFIGSAHLMLDSKAEQETSPGMELMEEDQDSHEAEPEDNQSQSALQLGGSPGHEISDEQTKVLEDPWETMKADDMGVMEEELCEEPAKPENINVASKAPGQASESEESLEDISPNASQTAERMEEELDSDKRIMLEETLPDSTPLRFYEKEMLAEATDDQQPPVSDAGGDESPAPESTAMLPEDVGQLEGRTTLTGSQEEDEPGTALAGTQERAAVEEDYFMVSAPMQETPHSEEAKVLEDFEESEVGTSNLPGADPEMHRAPSEEPRVERLSAAQLEEGAEGIFEQERDTGKESDGGEFPQEERELHSSDFNWELEKEGDFPTEENSCSSISGGAQMETDSTLAAIRLGDIEPEDAQKVSLLSSTADLADAMLEGQLPLSPKGSPNSSSPLSSKDEESPNVTQSNPASDPELSGGVEPKNAPEVNQSGMDHTVEVVAKIPAEVMKDSDILEIVEQALEFNQELMLGVRISELQAEGEQPAPGADEESTQTQEVGRDGNDSSPALSETSEAEAPQDTLGTSSPHAKDLTLSSHIWTESNTNGELNGLHDEQLLNGISDLQLLTDQNDCAKSREHEVSSSGEEVFGKGPFIQEFHEEEPLSETMQSQSPLQVPDDEEGHRLGEEHSKKGQVSSETDNGKFADIMQSTCTQRQDLESQTISVLAPFGDDAFHLGPSQHLKFQLKDDQESWSSEED